MLHNLKHSSLPEQQENFLFQGQLVLTLISVSVPPPVLRQQHVKDPGHSAKSAGGRMQLKRHAPYVCGFHEVTWCMVVWCTQNAPETAAVPCGTSHANAVSTYTTSVDIQKRAIKKKLFTHAESYTSAVSLLERGEQRYIKAINSYGQNAVCEFGTHSTGTTDAFLI